MASLIRIGQINSKICATCAFWEKGGDFLISAGYANSPETMEMDDDAIYTHAQCIKKRAQKSGRNSCREHRLHFSLMRYLR